MSGTEYKMDLKTELIRRDETVSLVSLVIRHKWNDSYNDKLH